MSQNTPSSNSNNQSNKKEQGGRKRPSFSLYWIYGLIIVVFLLIQVFDFMGKPLPKAELNELYGWMKDGDIEKIDVFEGTSVVEVHLNTDSAVFKAVYKDRVEVLPSGKVKPGPHFQVKIVPSLFLSEIEELRKSDDNSRGVVLNPVPKSDFLQHLSWLIPIGLMVVLWIFIMRRMSGGAGGGQIFNIGKSKAKLFDKDTNVLVNFDSVAGLDEAKVELMEIVDFLKNPNKYTQLGAKIPKGALLVGPPGTGKTLLAKAVAGEAKVPFFSLSGSDFVEMFVGVGASRVRDLFKQAKEKAPVIIFIDEIDAIGRARGKSIAQGANDERENTLNQLLTEMDGFESNVGIIILAATNRADILDKALLRPGRFDRQISVDLPDLNGRKEIFNVHMRDKQLDSSIDIELLAKQTPGFSGADIANVCNEAALIAARRNKSKINREDFNDAIDRVIGGLEKRNKVISPKEKKTIAYHEAGHATVSWLLAYASPLVKVTIIPRGQSLGAAWYLPEERQITTTDQLLDEMAATLGGRAAEQLVFNKISTGALSDLEKVTKQAYAMVSVYGLNDKIGNLSFYDSTGQSDYSFSKPYSEKTAELIDQEVKIMVEQSYQRALDLLGDNREKLDELANRLLEREILYREDLEEIFGARPSSDEADPEQDIKEAGAGNIIELEIEPTTPTLPESKSDDSQEG
jgi:ATP-dependent metalloprotease FtsH